MTVKKKQQVTRKPDFEGWATVYEIPCTDGRTIGVDAFKHQDGAQVPLVWRHNHNDMKSVVGHVLLHANDKGVRAKAYFNNTESGKHAKELVHAKDIQYLSVWANQLKEKLGRVAHGVIREVSLVLAGANPGARIDTVLVHSDSMLLDEELIEGILIHSGEQIDVEMVDNKDTIEHEDDTIGGVLTGLNEEQRGFFNFVIQTALGQKPSTEEADGEDNAISSIYESLSDTQKNVLHYIVGTIKSDDDKEEDKETVVKQSDIKTDENQGEIKMTNIFEQQNANNPDGNTGRAVLSHSDASAILQSARDGKVHSLKQHALGYLEHAGTYGIDNLDQLFPEAVTVNGAQPTLYGRDMAWVEKVMGAINPVGFSRIKSAYADITADEARAKGYITTNEKFEEVFPVLTRTTTPQTVYKKQKLDRDDILDITSFDLVAWLKAEMRVMLREEIARAVLVGDGRGVADPERINPANIRPIWQDDAVYAHSKIFTAAEGADILAIIDGIVAEQEHYRGQGEPVLYCSTAMLSAMMLVRDTTDRRIHATKAELTATPP